MRACGEGRSNAMKRRFGFKGRVLSMILIPVVICSLLLGVAGAVSVYRMGITSTKDELYTFGVSTLQRYQSMNDYNFVIKDDYLYKGDIRISNNYSVIDQLKNETGIETTVFYQDTRVTTTIRNADGNRIEGTKADDDIVNKVYKDGKTVFLDDVTIEGNQYSAYYYPLKQSGSNDTIGMLFVGKPVTTVRNAALMSALMLVIISAVLLVVFVLFGLVIVRRMSRSIVVATKSIDRVAKGDLTAESDDLALRRKDEIGDMVKATRQVVTSLSSIIGDIVDTSKNLDRFASEYAASFSSIDENIGNMESAYNEIAKGATSQAMETQQANEGVIHIGQALDEITGSVSKLDQSSVVMKEYNQTVNQTLEHLSDINQKTRDSVNTVYDQTNATNESANQIKSATDMITEIADQTNLLSLNASIEAARAGDQGRGFAVVADEIRNLSEQSRNSAEQIVVVISELIQNSDMSVHTMNHLKELMNSQNEMLTDTKNVFDNLNHEIVGVTDAVGSISSQIQALDQVKLSVTQIVESLAAIAEQNAASAQETSASMTQLQTIVRDCSGDTIQMKQIARDLVSKTDQFVLKAE